MLAHGGGGRETRLLINNIFAQYLGDRILQLEEDAALINMEGEMAYTADSFTVYPLFFKGGNIGKLAVTGTVNDLLVTGAEPRYITLGFVIEEGFFLEDLKKIIASIKEESEKNNIYIAAGDTKVVPKGHIDGLIISTSGIGRVLRKGLSSKNLREGDVIIFSGSVGDHGISLLALREGINSNLYSDCASLTEPLINVLKNCEGIKTMRDATRGGVAQVLNEWAIASRVEIEIEEEKIPIKETVKGICELLGFEPYSFANEGMVVIAVDEENANKVLEILRKFKETENASAVGRVVSEKYSRVVLKTPYGTKRILEMPSGEILPRIC